VRDLFWAPLQIITRATKSQSSAVFKVYETSTKPNFTLMPCATQKLLDQKKIKIYRQVKIYLAAQFFLILHILWKLQQQILICFCKC